MNWRPIRLKRYQLLPAGWFCYGIAERDRDRFPAIREQYFFLLWLPSYRFEYAAQWDEPRWQQLGILWLGVDGFRTVLRIADSASVLHQEK